MATVPHRMPAIFFGHGNPMNAIQQNSYTEGWTVIGRAMPRPKAILSVSAHWYLPGTSVTAMDPPRTIHDFGGFPRELYQVRYPAPGDADLASRVQSLLAPVPVGRDVHWGLDHGTWSVLAHMFPDADIPVVQLSINAVEPLEYHLDIGQRLAPLREQGVLIVASGNVVHNLRRVAWDRPTDGFDWNHRFGDAATTLLREAPGDILRLVDHDDYPLAVPTPDHFIPLLYIAALAAASSETPEILVDGFAYGSLSMTSYTLGADARPSAGSEAAAALPGPDRVPPEQANI